MLSVVIKSQEKPDWLSIAEILDLQGMSLYKPLEYLLASVKLAMLSTIARSQFEERQQMPYTLKLKSRE